MDEVKVSFQLKRHLDMNDGIERIKQVMREQCEHLPCLPTSATNISKYLIRLSELTVTRFVKGLLRVSPQSSRHLLVTGGGNMYKVLYRSDDILHFVQQKNETYFKMSSFL